MNERNTPTSRRPLRTSSGKQPGSGLACPRCNCNHFEVIKVTPKDGFVLRRKECRHCKFRVTTREVSMTKSAE